MNDENEKLTDLFRALSDPTRLEVVLRLAGCAAPQTVTDVTTCCGIHISGVSRHLARLRRAELVTAEKSGREVRYSLRTKELAALLRSAADRLEGCCDGEGCP